MESAVKNVKIALQLDVLIKWSSETLHRQIIYVV